MGINEILNLYTPLKWDEYELIDSGNGEKLEKYNQVIVRRPEPQALWDKNLSESEWHRLAHVKFVQKGSHSGEWRKQQLVDDHWKIQYRNHGLKLTFNLSLTSFKHIGIFPEQALNWDYIYSCVKGMKTEAPKVLNLFAYTGGASIAAKAAGADVTHVDSVKQVISWSRENMESSGLNDIRWVVEDALKFVKREVKRGKKYHGVILDPPAYGIGANGERWKLEDCINEMLKEVAQLIEDQEHFLILNMYSLGMSALISENMVKNIFGERKNMEVGEIYLQSKTEQRLPLGILTRFNNVL